MVVINSPSNPTGVCYTRAELAALGEVLHRHPHVLVATDDMYEHIVWGSEPFANILMVRPDLYERTIVLNGVSKAYSMTGWRIGYAAGPAPLIRAMVNIQSQSTSNPTSIAQVAAEAALDGDQSFIAEMVRAFKARHDYVVGALNGIRGVTCLPAQGAFYLFPDTRAAMQTVGVEDDVAFADLLLRETGVALVPGSAFGAPGFQRVSIATSLENLEKAIERLTAFLGAA
jgi:aspartate aminotransferase